MGPISFQLAILVAAFGAAGVLARFATVNLMARHFPLFPAGTFFVNIIGSFLIGCVFAAFAARSELPPAWKVILVSGFLGGFTTFSSFSWEVFEMYRDGRIPALFAYGMGAPVLGFLAAYLGAVITGKIIAL